MKQILTTLCLLCALSAQAQQSFAERDSLSKLPDFRTRISFAASMVANGYVNDTSKNGRLARYILAEPNGDWLYTLSRYAAQQSGIVWNPTDATIQSIVTAALPSLATIFQSATRNK